MTPAQKGSLAKLFAHGDTNIQKDGISESVVNGECASIQRVAYGEQYTRRNGKKSLKSNIEYVSQNGYKYSTDSSDRISHAEGSLKPGKATRNAYAQRTVGKGNGRLNKFKYRINNGRWKKSIFINKGV